MENENIWDLAGLQVDMSTQSLTGVDMTLAWHHASNIMQQTGTCEPWCLVSDLCHSQCTWMTPAKLQVDCRAGPKPPK